MNGIKSLYLWQFYFFERLRLPARRPRGVTSLTSGFPSACAQGRSLITSALITSPLITDSVPRSARPTWPQGTGAPPCARAALEVTCPPLANGEPRYCAVPRLRKCRRCPCPALPRPVPPPGMCWGRVRRPSQVSGEEFGGVSVVGKGLLLSWRFRPGRTRARRSRRGNPGPFALRLRRVRGPGDVLVSVFVSSSFAAEFPGNGREWPDLVFPRGESGAARFARVCLLTAGCFWGLCWGHRHCCVQPGAKTCLGQSILHHRHQIIIVSHCNLFNYVVYIEFEPGLLCTCWFIPILLCCSSSQPVVGDLAELLNRAFLPPWRLFTDTQRH